MATVAFDTHAYVKRLKAAGVPEEQAEVHAQTLAQFIEGELASRRDIEELRRDMKEMELEIKRDIEELRQATKRDIEELRQATKRDIEELRRDMKEMETGLRRDMKEMELALKRDIAEAIASLLKWLIGLLFLQAGFIVALIKLL